VTVETKLPVDDLAVN